MLLTRSSGSSLSQQVYSILQKYGTDAHVYLPGIGVINGLTAGNYLDSAGTTLATVDNPVGLVLDAAGNSIGRRNLLTYSEQFDNAAIAKVRSTISANAINAPNGTLTADKIVEDSTAANTHAVYHTVTTTAANHTQSAYLKAGERTWALLGHSGKTAFFNLAAGTIGTVSASSTAAIVSVGDGWYRCSLTALASAGSTLCLVYLATADNTNSYNGDGTSGAYVWGEQMELGSTASTYQQIVAGTSGDWATGIHAIQATTANKPILRLSGGRYYFDFVDGTDVLNATYPAGWESVTTIDAAPTGQATLTAQNIVGTYAITTDTYGRFVFKTITASELATIQTFANRLAGL